MPRLLIPVLSAVRGGAEEYAVAVAAGATTNGWEVHALVSKRPAMQGLARDLVLHGTTVHECPVDEVGVAHSILTRPFRVGSTRSALTRIAPHAVLLPLPGLRYGIEIMRRCIKLGVPCRPVYQLIRWEQWSASLATHLVPLLTNPLLRVIVVSDSDRTTLCDRTNLARDKVVVIHNGVDLESISAATADRRAARSRLRQSIGSSNESAVCLSVGRLHPQKGCDVLLNAIPKTLLSHPEVQFLWAGEGPLSQCLRDHAEIMGVENRFHLLGPREDVPELLAGADLFAFPSRYEGFPFALLEAMAARVPVVASDIPPVREAMGDNTAGLLVPPDDVYHLWRALSSALSEPDAAAARAETAFDRVQPFSKDHMCHQTLAELDACLEAPVHG